MRDRNLVFCAATSDARQNLSGCGASEHEPDAAFDKIFQAPAAKYGLSLMRLGISGGEAFRINSVRKKLTALKEIYFGEFAKIIKSED